MNNIRDKLIRKESNMWKEFQNIGKKLGDSDDKIKYLFNLLPTSIQSTDVIKDLLANRYLYKFGPPITLNEVNVIESYGSVETLNIENLYKSIKTADKYLDKNQINSFIQKINNIEKHEDFLFEMRPLFNLQNDLIPLYESIRNCVGNKNIDWEIHGKEYTLLFDVKKRIKPLIDHMEYCMDLVNKLNRGIKTENIEKPNISNSADLFRSTEEKFENQKDEKILQGVWINTSIIEDRRNLNDYFFNNLDSQKIQFAILASWSSEAYILVRDEAYKYILIDYFGLIESDRFVCSTYQDNII